MLAVLHVVLVALSRSVDTLRIRMRAHRLCLLPVGTAHGALDVLHVLQLLWVHDAGLLGTKRARAAVQLLACLLVDGVWGARVSLYHRCLMLHDLLGFDPLMLLRRHGTAFTRYPYGSLEATHERATAGLDLLVAG